MNSKKDVKEQIAAFFAKLDQFPKHPKEFNVVKAIREERDRDSL